MEQAEKMTKIPLAHVHVLNTENVFVNGKNLTNRFGVGTKGISELYFCPEDQFIHIVIEGKEAWMRGDCVMSLKIKEPVAYKGHAESPAAAANAQVGHPHGLAPAQVEVPTQKPPKPIGARKPKYQGEEA